MRKPGTIWAMIVDDSLNFESVKDTSWENSTNLRVILPDRLATQTQRSGKSYFS